MAGEDVGKLDHGSDADRRALEERLLDIWAGMVLAFLHEQYYVPIDRTLIAAEDYFHRLHRRTVRAIQYCDSMEER